ncbi:MAG: M20/M25/M40 family metallo-hydrolase [Sandarakinorhabdus sp.]|nr:M20/M25/M40 family metallo-hydrolase [Sandarakinorhabdus sp.]
MKFAASVALLALAAPLAAAEPDFSPERVKAHVAFLADDLLEGRGTGTRGHEIATRYVASQFAAAGLTPAGKDGGWLQPVTLSEASLGTPKAQVTITGKAGATSFAHATEVLVGPSQLNPVTDVSAQVVFVGFGIDAPKQGFDDYAGVDVRGKIVAVFGGIPKGPPNEVLAHLGGQKGVMAAAHGAIGLVQIPTLDSMKRRPWDRNLQYANTPSMTWVKADGTPFVRAPGIKASANFSMVAAEKLFAGSKVPLARLLAQADKNRGMPKGFALATSVRIEAASTQRLVQTANVVGMIPGSDPVLKDEAVVLMAHLDHLGIEPDKKGDGIYNGALDNAAGVAVMLEVARAFGGDAVKPKRTLIFSANTAEEKGLLGAESFANNPPVPIANIASVVDLDQPLLLYDFTDVIAFGGDHSTMGQAIARAAAKAGVALSPDPMPEETIFVRSDHYTFVKRGVPALLLATGFANGGKEAWEHFLATDYHQPSDDMKLPINWNAGAKYARVNYLIAREIADGAQRPRWYEGDYFGTTFAADAPKVARPAPVRK